MEICFASRSVASRMWTTRGRRPTPAPMRSASISLGKVAGLSSRKSRGRSSPRAGWCDEGRCVCQSRRRTRSMQSRRRVGLDGIQLHGDERPELICATCRKGLSVVRAYRCGIDGLEPLARLSGRMPNGRANAGRGAHRCRRRTANLAARASAPIGRESPKSVRCRRTSAHPRGRIDARQCGGCYRGGAPRRRRCGQRRRAAAGRKDHKLMSEFVAARAECIC